MDTELKIPHISTTLTDYLNTFYGVDFLLTYQGNSAEEKIGYIRGVREVLTHLQGLQEEQEEYR